MKLFTTIKTGYTAGVYGCSGEYFTLILIKQKRGQEQPTTSFYHFQGMYGVEKRVQAKCRELGYTEFYANANFGKLTRKDIFKNTLSENQMLDVLDGAI